MTMKLGAFTYKAPTSMANAGFAQPFGLHSRAYPSFHASLLTAYIPWVAAGRRRTPLPVLVGATHCPARNSSPKATQPTNPPNDPMPEHRRPASLQPPELLVFQLVEVKFRAPELAATLSNMRTSYLVC